MKSKQISIRVPLSTYKVLEKIGEAKDLTISQLIRSLIRNLMAKPVK